MGEIVNPALAGIRRQLNSSMPELRAKADAWSARNDLRNYTGSLHEIAALVPEFDRRSLADGDHTLVRKDGTGIAKSALVLRASSAVTP